MDSSFISELLGVDTSSSKQLLKDYFRDYNKKYDEESFDLSYMSSEVLMAQKLLMHRDYFLQGKQDEIMSGQEMKHGFTL